MLTSTWAPVEERKSRVNKMNNGPTISIFWQSQFRKKRNSLFMKRIELGVHILWDYQTGRNGPGRAVQRKPELPYNLLWWAFSLLRFVSFERFFTFKKKMYFFPLLLFFPFFFQFFIFFIFRSPSRDPLRAPSQLCSSNNEKVRAIWRQEPYSPVQPLISNYTRTPLLSTRQ